ncbi:MAG: glycosyltransferase family 2 protein [Oscillatoria sp. PMC 1068.18]|nr:glycosyltransferase family 2 protein [Oscillatoria sp. PMC 1076.18]MEC4990870.1 glycosyltransferase family 2 protein [Oscillatoria sp. PMC 1068.18]
MKLVSVIIPVYNVEQYIAATVKSALEQTYPNLELLIIDDGSPDRSIEICQQFSDRRIKIIRQENQGLPSALNTGIRNSRGTYIAFLDGDDLWLPEKLTKQIEHLESCPEVGVSFSRSALIDEAGNELGTYLMPQLRGIDPFSLLRSNPVGNGSAAAIRREVFEEVGYYGEKNGSSEVFYFDEELTRSHDTEFLLRIAIKTNWLIEGIPEALTLYRINSEGLSANYLKKLESWEQVLLKVRGYAPEKIVCWESVSKAYHLRYLARKAIRLHDGDVALHLVWRAIATHPRICVEEPLRTLLTFSAAVALYFLPLSFYQQIEAVATKLTGSSQKRRILSERL